MFFAFACWMLNFVSTQLDGYFGCIMWEFEEECRRCRICHFQVFCLCLDLWILFWCMSYQLKEDYHFELDAK